MIILFLNGPPASGKDTVGGIIQELVGSDRCALERMSEPLKASVKAFFALSDEEYNTFNTEPLKSTPDPRLLNMSLRQFQIDLSEDFIKPRFGRPVFGRLLLSRLDFSKRLTVITDSGFPQEAKPIVDAFGTASCRLVRLYREGKTFIGDSRSYIELPNVCTAELINDGDLLELREKIKTCLQSIGLAHLLPRSSS